ncbi:pyridoxal 5'-phosphate synthase glutaminase subunit PdxT [Gilliamella sp. B2776]|uniref:pyridoxal 5'-phosphate synthase glutaminase subunit PdxT n=1 Tax=unclassified Gilliamella TaxID=2685620 RepID=UPI00226A6849|nr:MULTISPECIES: pyridoxal 5'-phosphate synthase glutaminase subunit PdxT [unclassified Gilliamella]MCX8650490.1 pyridoxal 5'-phosphate synthase glutaminase subunit PdxT [Gilliamella sp. B2779]MCX8654464.1 pyridoxal 5'-phosphate synthase glutaminase subunit PdxT [Gilliamella sp. B2737]MCX8656795.1 pyridoxal 5'-phosphate synthase glutaminase subunit PdxT [Gilliamella sp. B2894]MCX8692338.1 pyridoxal 5'-phosphate synthase glutaminase subunit PdxT [Gilliamella sp. B2776]MCX8694199.1 pyridoxal 5'-
MTKSKISNHFKKIGVLNLQGAVSEHITMLNSLDNVQAIAVKNPEQLAKLNGLIIPGGESTTISRLIKQNGLFEPIKQFVQQGKGILGTCAGLVLCGKTTTHNEIEQLSLIDINVERNGFGRQISSFETRLDVKLIGKKIPAVFIRAPYIAKASKQVEQLAFIDGRCVMAKQGKILVCAFHPELTQDNRITQYFVNSC